MSKLLLAVLSDSANHYLLLQLSIQWTLKTAGYVSFGMSFSIKMLMSEFITADFMIRWSCYIVPMPIKMAGDDT